MHLCEIGSMDVLFGLLLDWNRSSICALCTNGWPVYWIKHTTQ